MSTTRAYDGTLHFDGVPDYLLRMKALWVTPKRRPARARGFFVGVLLLYWLWRKGK